MCELPALIAELLAQALQQAVQLFLGQRVAMLDADHARRRAARREQAGQVYALPGGARPGATQLELLDVVGLDPRPSPDKLCR